MDLDISVVTSVSVKFFKHPVMEGKTESAGQMLVHGEPDVNGHTLI